MIEVDFTVDVLALYCIEIVLNSFYKYIFFG